jgi:hypothetical protein
MMGFNLPPVHEVYLYVNNDNLAAFLDIIAFEIDDFLQQFTHQQVRNVAFPYYYSLFNGIKQTCAVLPNSSFIYFLDEALTFKNRGGAYNVNSKTFNKYATAEFKENSDVGGSMRGGYTQEEKETIYEDFKGKANISGVPTLTELKLKSTKNAYEDDKKEIQELLEYIKTEKKDTILYAKLFKALYGDPPPPGPGPSASAPAQQNTPSSATTLAIPAKPIEFNIQNVQGTLSPYLAQGTTLVQIQDGLNNLAAIAADPRLGPAKAWSIARGLQMRGEIVNMGGYGATIKTKSGAIITPSFRKILEEEEGADLRAEEEAIMAAKEKFLLTKLGAGTVFFTKLNEEFTNGGENIKRICRRFFLQFKPSFEEASSFAESINMAILEERKTKKAFVEKYSLLKNPANSQNYSTKKNDDASSRAFDAAQQSLNSQTATTSISDKEEAAIKAATAEAMKSGLKKADADVIAKFIVSQLIANPRGSIRNLTAEDKIRKAILQDAKQAVQNMRLHATVLSTGVGYSRKQNAIFGGVVSVELLSAHKYLQWRGWETYI